jgi:hypothetical protein
MTEPRTEIVAVRLKTAIYALEDSLPFTSNDQPALVSDICMALQYARNALKKCANAHMQNAPGAELANAVSKK